MPSNILPKPSTARQQPRVPSLRLVRCRIAAFLHSLSGLRFVNRFAPNEGPQHTNGEYLARRNSRNVLRDDRQIGELAFFDRTFVLFFKLRVGRLDRVASQSLFEREFLLGVPPAWRIALRIGPRNGCIQAMERVERFAGKVRTQRQVRAGVFDRAPGVSVLDPFRAETLLRPRHIGSAMGRLHRSDDPSFAKRGISSGARTWACS